MFELKFVNTMNLASLSKLNIRYRRMLLPALLIALVANVDTRILVESVLTDAFIQVSAFVAATLALYYGLSKQCSRFITENIVSKYQSIELIGSAFLGALPGCG